MMLLETKSLARSFGGLNAVAGVDFTLQEGEIRAIIGPNGAGKTTFVSLIAGRIPPSEGSIRFAGEDITALHDFQRVRRGIAYTFQITSVFANLSVQENVRLAARTAEVDEYLSRVELLERREQIAGTLSYGHQRLLEVAMGLALKPRLIIFDEPTQGLSDGEIAHFISLVRTIAQHATVLLIEHNMKVVMTLANRITVMNHGRILAEGTPEEIRANAAVQAAYLGAS